MAAYRAVVFDLDGVLWDGEPLYHEAFNIVLKPYRHVITPEAGVHEVLAELKARGIPVGLASASLRNWVDATIMGLGLDGQFATTVTASEVERSKPEPDLYLEAAKNLGVDGSLCVAVEDTRAGVRAAKAAGMYVIQVRAASTALEPIAEADAVIDDYSQFDLALLSGAAVR
jgi:HAD superfamily hydrolase (TIGR01509 family)